VKISNGKWTINDNAKTEFWFMKGKNIICATGENLIKVSPKTLNTESAISLKESVKQLKNEDFHKNFSCLKTKDKLFFLLMKNKDKNSRAGIYLRELDDNDHLKANQFYWELWTEPSGASLIFVQCIIGL